MTLKSVKIMNVWSLRMCVILPLFLCLGGCGEDETRKQPSAATAQQESDAELMQDIDRAGVELERRLGESVHAADGLVIIHQPVVGESLSYVLSANTSWILSCGVAGISIVFGSSVTGDGTSVSNDVEIRLAYSAVNEKKCAVLGPRLGKGLKTLFREASAS
jgi:hypothetical protein